MPSPVATLSQSLRRRGLARGVFGTSRPWLIVWSVITAGRLVRRVTKHKPEVVYKGTLEPGQTLVIAHENEVIDVTGPEPARS